MRCSKTILLSALLLASNSAFSAITTVPPGNGLQAAIAAASEGDTILLETGVYTNVDTTVDVGVSLTIKAASAAMSPIIQDSLYVPSGISIDKLTVQGVQVDGVWFGPNSDVSELEILETTLIASNTGGNNAGLKKFSMIGSSVPCSYTTLDIYAENIVFAGNNICLRSWMRFSSIGSGDETATIVGNTFVFQSINSHLIVNSWADVTISANRFIQEFAAPGTLPSSPSSTMYFVSHSNVERLTAKNNLFVAKPDRLAVGTKLRAIKPFSYTANLHFENNLVDAGNIDIWAPSLGESEQDGMMQNGTTVPASLKGNIFINYKDNILPLPAVGIAANAQFNLCFNNTTNCGASDGNLTVDPLLLDSIDYKLGASSPAINSGPTGVALSDLDGTRNNMGPYGGSWSLDQYDAQRAVDAVGPYLYPIVEAAKGVANGDVKVKFVSYGRQL